MGEAIESGLKKFGVTVSKPVLARIAYHNKRLKH